MGISTSPAAPVKFARRNYVVLIGAVSVIGVGYWLLGQGSTGLAPVLLVVGYCVLFPLALAL